MMPAMSLRAQAQHMGSISAVRRAPAASIAPRIALPARRRVACGFKTAEAPSSSSTKELAMDCYQCEQTLNRVGCHDVGVCGKTPEVAALQDLLIYQAKGLGCLSHHARAQGITDPAIDSFINGIIFSTLTNVNFSDERMYEFIMEAETFKNQLRGQLKAAGKPQPTASVTGAAYWGEMPHPVDFTISGKPSMEAMVAMSKKTAITIRKRSLGETLTGLQELIVYGLKGMCAYAHHAEALGKSDPKVSAFVAEALTFLSSTESSTVPAVLGMALRVGEVNLRVLELLSTGHSDRLGVPTPTDVTLLPTPGKAILVTGHDMNDLELLLKQTEGKGVNVYTHGEMLPAHGYPGLKKFKHLAGHFGGAWYRQKTDFARFPGSILVTTNCVLDPLPSYRDSMFTLNETGVSGVRHIPNKDFTPLIERAQQLPGFTPADVKAAERGDSVAVIAGSNTGRRSVTVGFGHAAVLNVAGDVIKAIEDKRLQHIFLIGGCDGNELQRAFYYNQLYKYMPQETLILTMGCGKFRIFDQDFGNLPGTQIPRLLDMGQCNDSYSAIVVATELAKALKTDVNSLPLSLDLSWFEQKAVVVLLSLLHLGIRNIRLGPRLPAFLTADAVKVLVDTYNLQPADESHPEEDVKRMMMCH